MDSHLLRLDSYNMLKQVGFISGRQILTVWQIQLLITWVSFFTSGCESNLFSLLFNATFLNLPSNFKMCGEDADWGTLENEIHTS